MASIEELKVPEEKGPEKNPFNSTVLRPEELAELNGKAGDGTINNADPGQNGSFAGINTVQSNKGRNKQKEEELKSYRAAAFVSQQARNLEIFSVAQDFVYDIEAEMEKFQELEQQLKDGTLKMENLKGEVINLQEQREQIYLNSDTDWKETIGGASYVDEDGRTITAYEGDFGSLEYWAKNQDGTYEMLKGDAAHEAEQRIYDKLLNEPSLQQDEKQLVEIRSKNNQSIHDYMKTGEHVEITKEQMKELAHADISKEEMSHVKDNLAKLKEGEITIDEFKESLPENLRQRFLEQHSDKLEQINEKYASNEHNTSRTGISASAEKTGGLSKTFNPQANPEPQPEPGLANEGPALATQQMAPAHTL